MFLALSDIVTVPFGALLAWLYRFTQNYGVALILFAIIVKIILFPLTAKSKKSSMKMSRMTPRINALREKYANDPQKMNESIQALYREEGVSMGGGCLWSLIPLLILFPLYTVVRYPITYILSETTAVANHIMLIIENAIHVSNNELNVLISAAQQAGNTELVAELTAKLAGSFSSNDIYAQMSAAALIPQYAEQIRTALPSISEATLQGVNFTFLGIDLSAIPSYNVFAWKSFSWANIGAFLVPVLSAGSQVLTMWVSTRLNNSVITNEKGLVDEEEAKKSQAAQTSKTMMWLMPIMSLFIGFSFPAALSLYWLIQGMVAMVGDVYLTKKYRKIYDAEDAERLKKTLEQDRIEAEKERLRAEKRAANPDGITENTSKKKLQQKQQREAEAAKAAAAKEYAVKKGLAEEETVVEKTTLSGIADRPYCKGRAYDPNRYSNNTEE